MDEAETLSVIPREIQDILTMKATERHRWLADGRLPSAGTRTVRLNGRARQSTFHVFDLKVVEELLNQGAIDEWRERDAEAKPEKKREAAYKAKLTRSLRAKKATKVSRTDPGGSATSLRGWDVFNHPWTAKVTTRPRCWSLAARSVVSGGGVFSRSWLWNFRGRACIHQDDERKPQHSRCRTRAPSGEGNAGSNYSCCYSWSRCSGP